jgi:Tol biopolymer transport system component
MRVLAVAALSLLLLPLAAAPGQAAYPGRNGTIVFVRGGDLWTIRPDGTALTRLTRTTAKEANPAWSPDGAKIAFDSGGSIYVTDAQGKKPVNLSAVEADPASGSCDSNPTWSPDGKQIALSAVTDDCTGAAGEIDAMGSDGKGRHIIENDYSGILGGDDEPAWGPGGGRIAFTRSDSERMASGPYDYDIWILDTRTGKALRALTANSRSTSPSWRPNGLQIAFAGPKGITVMSAAGKAPTFLVRGGSPAWSPDSGQIVYVGKGGLSIVRTNGSRAQRLLLKCSCASPDWQPQPR